nr:MAG TPA: Protein of unknown function (DUF1653) [Caudoviricetes sp.]
MEVIDRLYKHFKGRLYYVHNIAEHSETGEVFVVYQAMYPPYKVYVRPYKMFMGDIDPNRPDNITGQSKRFEQIIY